MSAKKSPEGSVSSAEESTPQALNPYIRGQEQSHFDASKDYLMKNKFNKDGDYYVFEEKKEENPGRSIVNVLLREGNPWTVDQISVVIASCEAVKKDGYRHQKGKLESGELYTIMMQLREVLYSRGFKNNSSISFSSDQVNDLLSEVAWFKVHEIEVNEKKDEVLSSGSVVQPPEDDSHVVQVSLSKDELNTYERLTTERGRVAFMALREGRRW